MAKSFPVFAPKIGTFCYSLKGLTLAAGSCVVVGLFSNKNKNSPFFSKFGKKMLLLIRSVDANML